MRGGVTPAPRVGRSAGWGLPADAVRWLGVVAVAAATVAEFAAPGWSTRWASWPLAVGVLTIGMSHGAVDFHLLRAAPDRWRQGLVYGIALIGAAGWWLLSPSSAVVAFLLLSAWHFGREYAEHAAPPGSRPTAVVGGSHGGLVLGLPLLVHPGASADFFARVAAIGFVERSAGLGLAAPSFARLGAVLVAGAVACLALMLRASPVDRWKRLADVAVIGAGGALLHPEFFIGWYLLVWHAPSHYAQLSRAGGFRSLRSLWLDTTVFFLPAVGAVVGLAAAAWARFAVEPVAAISGSAVLVYLVVTPPHELLAAQPPGRRRLRWAPLPAQSRGGPPNRRRPAEASCRGETVSRTTETADA